DRVQSRGDETRRDPDARAEPAAHDDVPDEGHGRTRTRDADAETQFSFVEQPAVPAIRGQVAVLVRETRVACCLGVERAVMPQHVPGTTSSTTEVFGTVRVVRGVFGGVMIPVDLRPL